MFGRKGGPGLLHHILDDLNVLNQGIPTRWAASCAQMVCVLAKSVHESEFFPIRCECYREATI
jgi:hypothetical protein